MTFSHAFPFALIALLLYLTSGIWQACVLMRTSEPHPALIRTLGLAGTLSHGIVIYLMVYHHHGFLNLGILEALSMVCWLTTLLLLLTSLFVPLIAASSVLLPLSAICLIAQIILPASLNYSQYPAGVLAHIAGSILAFSLFAIAAAQACLIALQYRALKSGKLRGIIQVLPPLTRMENLLSALLGLGIIFLTIAIVSGAVFDPDFPGHFSTSKAVLSLLAWVIFAGLLIWRRYKGWRGRQAVYWTLIGAAVILSIFISSQLLFVQ